MDEVSVFGQYCTIFLLILELGPDGFKKNRPELENSRRCF
jgi:hypothetical protein